MGRYSLLITGSAVRVRPREPYSARVCGRSVLTAVVPLLAACLLSAAPARASEPYITQVCLFDGTDMVCASIFEADTMFDSQSAPLNTPAGAGFARVGYHDAATGKFVELWASHYTDRFMTAWPMERTLLLVQNPEWVSTGGFECEVEHPLR